ncbi:hypothetical protein [Jidongwangia harbinensis]|uniref:hypothetical protein n=1 Tax=Jidongwangia harbinensis TaxID=2878561 RepID=UPI001CDA1153|nr:hypothetical protein [Jidongwangia harbinensis]MCA2213456.1 hypothetical protein [Jidongwangia harbinensis]
MRTRRLAGSTLGVLAAVAFAVSGCAEGGDAGTPGAGTTSGAPSPSASTGTADPAAAEALGKATAALGNTSFKVTMTSGPGFQLTGLMDAPNGKATGELAVTGTNAEIKVKTLIIEQDLYVQIPGITKGSTWTHVDVSRLPEGANVGLRPGQIDPANTADLLASSTDVQQVDPRSYRGTLDLTKAAGIAGLDQVTVDGYGAAGQNVPFTAGLDDQGRLSALTIQLPAAANGQQAQPLEVLYTDYGTTVNAQRPPAGQITEAPNDLYTSLGG